MRRKSLFGALFGVVVAAGGTGHVAAAPASVFRGFAEAVITTTNADPWIGDDSCAGGTSRKDPLYIIAPGDTTTSTCTAVAGAPVVVVAAGFFCWEARQKEARDECTSGWDDPAAALVSATVDIDGHHLRVDRHDAVGRVSFSDSLFGESDGTVAATYSIMQGAVVDSLGVGQHAVHLTFAYADGFTGDTTVTLTVAG